MNIDYFFFKKLIFFLFLILVQFMLVMPEWASAADSGWKDVSDEWGQQNQRMNVFIETSDIYVKTGVALVTSILLYFAFLYLFKILIRGEKSPSKCFTVTFSLFLISLYWVMFFCFSEYTIVDQYKDDISIRDYFSLISIKLVIFSFVGWSVISMILSTAFSNDTANNS